MKLVSHEEFFNSFVNFCISRATTTTKNYCISLIFDKNFVYKTYMLGAGRMGRDCGLAPKQGTTRTRAGVNAQPRESRMCYPASLFHCVLYAHGVYNRVQKKKKEKKEKKKSE